MGRPPIDGYVLLAIIGVLVAIAILTIVAIIQDVT